MPVHYESWKMSSEIQKIGFVSLGCPKNLVDSEVMMGQLKQHGYELTTDREAADVIVVNTCGFIQSAKEESINTILEMSQLKDSGNLKRLVVAGCLVERYRQDLLNQMPEVDAVLGTSEIEKIIAAVDPAAVAAQDSEFVASNAWMTRGLPTYLYDENSPRVLATPKHYAYLKIAEGCDHTCAFCAIPQMRGNYRSRRAGSILREAEQLAAQGVKELVLISQDSTQYGLDLGIKDGLADLLRIDGRLAAERQPHGSLGVVVHEQRSVPAPGEGQREIEGGRGLADATLLTEHRKRYHSESSCG